MMSAQEGTDGKTNGLKNGQQKGEIRGETEGGLPDFRCVWNRTAEGQAIERALEAGSDALLRRMEQSPVYPAYTEAQLERHGEGKRLPLNDAFLENVTAIQGRKEFLDEMLFLVGMSGLSVTEQCVLFATLEGDTQEEIASRFAPPLSQQQVSRTLRKALYKCYAWNDLSFSMASRHTIYRRPAHRKHLERGTFCLRCGDWFPFGLGAGRYCSERCRGTRRGE